MSSSQNDASAGQKKSAASAVIAAALLVAVLVCTGCLFYVLDASFSQQERQARQIEALEADLALAQEAQQAIVSVLQKNNRAFDAALAAQTENIGLLHKEDADLRKDIDALTGQNVILQGERKLAAEEVQRLRQDLEKIYHHAVAMHEKQRSLSEAVQLYIDRQVLAFSDAPPPARTFNFYQGSEWREAAHRAAAASRRHGGFASGWLPLGDSRGFLFRYDGIGLGQSSQMDLVNKRLESVLVLAPGLSAVSGGEITIAAASDGTDRVILDGCLSWEELPAQDGMQKWQASDSDNQMRFVKVTQGVPVTRQASCDNRYLDYYHAVQLQQRLPSVVQLPVIGQRDARLSGLPLGACLRFTGCVDGSDFLISSGGILEHKHRSFSQIGTHPSCPFDLRVNGGGYFLNGQEIRAGEKIHIGFDMRDFKVIKARGRVERVEQGILLLNDDMAGGSDRYEVDLCP
ncbi:MAG: hypothetical protein Q8K65_08875 [Alphaproteobacteria bacterium]|nr:hypothetical protein [Alphaproteobacteria bacterium]